MMNIHSVSPNVSSPAFTGFNVSKLTEVIPDTKVCKNLTQLDKSALHFYIDAKSYRMGISPKEVAELNKHDGCDFILKSYDLLTKKLGFGENIRPALYLQEIPGEARAMYSNLVNVIYVDPVKMEKLNKTEMFGFLRHELQHYIQNIRVLRHEEFGPKSIDLAVQKYFETERNMMLHVCTQFSDQDIHNLAFSQNQQNPVLLVQTIMNAKRCLMTNDMYGFNKICENTTESYRKQLTNLRDNIINELGVIKKDSSLTPKIENDFKELTEMGYFNPDGTINNVKYAESKIENEAYNAQGAASFEFSQEPCFIHFIKNQYKRDLQDETTLKFLNDVLG